MDFNNGVLVLYMITAVVVGVFIYKEFEVMQENFLVKKNLGPSYWGVYQGCAASEAVHLQTIVPPAPCSGEDGTTGSAKYSSGRAVNTARS